MTVSTKPNRPFLLGVSGGSGSGKTYFARDLVRLLGQHICEIVYQDNFYIDQSQRFDFDGGSVNFDHPSSIDFNLLAKCLENLKCGNPTEIPVYDFATHKRKPEKLTIAAKPLIIVDGILIFHFEGVRRLFDDLIFFDTAEELRFQRRLERDMTERGRTRDGVHKQFYNQVKPMHDAFVEPSKIHAKNVVNSESEYGTILGRYRTRLLNRAT